MDRSKVLTQWPAFRGKWRAGEVLRGGLSRIALRVSSCHPLRGDDGSCCQPGALSERVGQCPVPVEGGRPTPAHAGRRVWPVASSRVPCSDGTGPGRRLMPVLSARIQSCAGKRLAGGGHGSARTGRRRKSRHEDTAKCRRNPVNDPAGVGMVPTHRQSVCRANPAPSQTFRGFTSQILSAYSRIVRSLEKMPMPATLMTAFRFQASWSRYSASTFSCVAT